MADRRKLQNFACLPHYLTDELWSGIGNEAREKSTLKLLRHSWSLGLRCPSETTFSVLDNIMRLHGPSDMSRKASSFERYQEIGDLKKLWKKIKQGKITAGEDLTYQDYVEQLPRDPRDLPAEYYLLAFANDTPAECRDWNGSAQCFFCRYSRVKAKEINFILVALHILRYSS